MSFITIKIEKVVIEANSELLDEINKKLDQLLQNDDALKQEISDKLRSATEQIKSIV